MEDAALDIVIRNFLANHTAEQLHLLSSTDQLQFYRAHRGECCVMRQCWIPLLTFLVVGLRFLRRAVPFSSSTYFLLGFSTRFMKSDRHHLA